jgi:predicted Zn-ribbon and HTH transcriptional regulator
MSKEYFHCKNCLMQDYDAAVYKMPEVCPICGSKQIEMIYPE